LTGVGDVAIRPVNAAPSHDQYGWRIRLRGRPWESTVATVAQTIRWAISTNAGATDERSLIP
jgi:hypothetical protein